MKWILKSALVLGLPFIFLYAYNYSPIEINIYGFVLKKINTADFKEDSLDNSINSSNSQCRPVTKFSDLLIIVIDYVLTATLIANININIITICQQIKDI